MANRIKGLLQRVQSAFSRVPSETIERAGAQLADTLPEPPPGEADNLSSETAQPQPTSSPTGADIQSSLERASAVSELIQGEVLKLANVCVFVTDPTWPLSRGSQELASRAVEDTLITVTIKSDLVVLITQTCDLQDTTEEEYLCQVAPIAYIDEKEAEKTARGHFPGWIALPWHSEKSVASLTQSTTVERSVLIGAESLGRPITTREQLHFAEMTSRHFTRFAFPDDVVLALKPFMARMKEKHDKASPEGKCAVSVGSIRVEATPSFEDECPDLTVILVIPSEILSPLPVMTGPDQRPRPIELDQRRIDDLKRSGIATVAQFVLTEYDPQKKHEAWTALAELWLDPSIEAATSIAGVGEIEIEVLSGEEFSYERSRNAPELDLAYLTTRPAKKAK